MTTFCDILYRKYLSTTNNEPIGINKEYLNTPVHFNNSLINFKSAPNLLMHILGSAFIYKYLHKELTYKQEKFNYLKYVLDNPFLTYIQKNEFIAIFQDVQRIHNNLCKLVRKYKWKKSKLANQHDLIMNPINENQYFVCTLLQHGIKYLFTKSDLTKIIENALINSPYIYAEPLPIKNPYNNSILDKSHLYTIYFFMKHGGFILPSIFHQYFLHNFHLKVFRNNTECMIRDMHIKTMANSNNPRLRRNINTMLDLYNTQCNVANMKIIIHKTFPEDVLIRAMKPYLHLFYTSNYSLCISSKTNAHIDLIYELNRFKTKSPGFGRKYINIINVNNLFCKKHRVCDYITEYPQYINNCYYKNYETSHIEIIEDNTDAEKEHIISLYTTFLTNTNIFDNDEDEDEDEDDEIDDTHDD
jgi:hypothetical protein